MKDFNTELIEALAQGTDITEIFRKQLEDAINFLLETERTAFLGFEPYEVSGYNSGNSRNGFYSRSLKTKYGTLNLKIPRDRNGEFSQRTIPSFKDSNDNLENTILMFYRKGLTTREISEIIEKMYGHHYSAQTVSNISETIYQEIEEFKNGPIRNRYAVVYCDTTFLPVRRGTVSKEALHIIIGMTEEGYKEILDFEIYPQESAENYKDMLRNLKSRGLEYVLLFISDELTALADTLTNEFPQSKHQSCWTHLLRNVASKVRAKDKREILDDLKEVYQKSTLEEAEEALKFFFGKWSNKYPKVKESLEEKENIFTFLNFPESIRASIYTNNISESFNKQFKRKAKVKEQFPHENSLENMSTLMFPNTMLHLVIEFTKGLVRYNMS